MSDTLVNLAGSRGWLSTKALAHVLGADARSVQRLAKLGRPPFDEIPFYVLGREYRFSLPATNRLLEKMGQTPLTDDEVNELVTRLELDEEAAP